MKNHWEVEGATDEEVLDFLLNVAKRKIRTEEDGIRTIYDPVAGLWFTDQEAVDQYRRRQKGRRVFDGGGTRTEGEETSRAMNRQGL